MTEKKENRQLFRTQIRVIYADTDKMSAVYHANYLKYFEIGRNEMLRQIELPYAYMESKNLYLPIIESQLYYYRPAHYDDLLTVQTHAEKQKMIRFKMHCQIYRKAELLVEGYTVHVTCNSDGQVSKPNRDIYRRFCEALFAK